MLLLLFLIFIIMNHESWRWWGTMTRTAWELRAVGDWFIGLRIHAFNIHQQTLFMLLSKLIFFKSTFLNMLWIQNTLHSTRSQTNYNPNPSIFRHKKLQQAEWIPDFSSSIQRIYFIIKLVDEVWKEEHSTFFLNLVKRKITDDRASHFYKNTQLAHKLRFAVRFAIMDCK